MSRSPHDALIKETLSTPANAAEAFRAVLPIDLSRRLDWASLKLESSAFIDEKLRKRFGDLLFSVRTRPSKRRLFLFLHVEHQSTDERFFVLRQLRYCVDIWQRHLKEKPNADTLPMIIPVVLHHSERGWRSATRLEDLFDLDAETRQALGTWVPQFSLMLDDISHIDDDQLRQRVMSEHMRLTLLFLKHSRNDKALLQRLKDWADLVDALLTRRNGVEAFAVLIRYYAAVTQLEPQTVRDQFIYALGPKVENAMATAAEVLEARGELKGKAELFVAILRTKFPKLPDEVCTQVLACQDHAQLDAWAQSVFAIATPHELLAIKPKPAKAKRSRSTKK